MRTQPAAGPRAPSRAGKKQDAPKPVAHSKSKSRSAIEHEDDWMPIAATMTPTRVIREFIENDYDMM